jgi:hypothetical protein
MAHADERRRGGLRALGQRPRLLLVTTVAMVGALSLLSGPAVAQHGPDFWHGGGAGRGPRFAPHWNGQGFGGPGWGHPWPGALDWRGPTGQSRFGGYPVAAGVSGTMRTPTGVMLVTAIRAGIGGVPGVGVGRHLMARFSWQSEVRDS